MNLKHSEYNWQTIAEYKNLISNIDNEIKKKLNLLPYHDFLFKYTYLREINFGYSKNVNSGKAMAFKVHTFNNPIIKDSIGYYEATNLLLNRGLHNINDINILNGIIIGSKTASKFCADKKYISKGGKIDIKILGGCSLNLYKSTLDEYIFKNSYSYTNDILYNIGEFIYQFIIQHPYKDGNGRTSRILTEYLFYKHGIISNPWIYHGYNIHSTKTLYYQLLNDLDKNYGDNIKLFNAYILNMILYSILDLLEIVNKIFDLYSRYKSIDTELGLEYSNFILKPLLNLRTINPGFKKISHYYNIKNDSYFISGCNYFINYELIKILSNHNN